MKQHKVIVKVMESVKLNSVSYTGKLIATYERVYPSKSAAINSAREISQSGIFKHYRDNDGFLDYRHYLNVHVEDMNGRKFNYCLDSGVSSDFDDIRNFEELTINDCVAMLTARCFQIV